MGSMGTKWEILKSDGADLHWEKGEVKKSQGGAGQNGKFLRLGGGGKLGKSWVWIFNIFGVLGLSGLSGLLSHWTKRLIEKYNFSPSKIWFLLTKLGRNCVKFFVSLWSFWSFGSFKSYGSFGSLGLLGLLGLSGLLGLLGLLSPWTKRLIQNTNSISPSKGQKWKF